MKAISATDRFYKELWPHRQAVLRLARILTHSDSDADDLAQETLLRAYRGIEGLSPGSNARAWLMTILRNAHTDQLRSKRQAELSLDALEVDLPDEQAAPPEDPAAWGDPERTLAEFSDDQIIAALRALPRDICWTLLLVDVQQMDNDEAGQILGVPTGTIKSRLHRGRRMLRDRLLPLIQSKAQKNQTR
jgi:RNA polymerase sigma-70 factor (ECF subfamily)